MASHVGRLPTSGEWQQESFSHFVECASQHNPQDAFAPWFMAVYKHAIEWGSGG